MKTKLISCLAALFIFACFPIAVVGQDINPDETFLMGSCYEEGPDAPNVRVSLNDLMDREQWRRVDALEILYTWEDPGEDEIVHARAAWLRRELCKEIYNQSGGTLCEFEVWEAVKDIRNGEDWLYYLRTTISLERLQWKRARALVKALER